MMCSLSARLGFLPCGFLQRGFLKCGIALLVPMLLALPGLVRGEGRVDFELVTESGFPLDGAREWLSALDKVGLSGVRIRGANDSDQPSIERRGSDASPSYHVVGILTAANKLRVPGGSFGVRDQGRISAWVAKLKEGGEEGLSAKPSAFGLLPKQLVELHQSLALPVTFSTVGLSASEVVTKIAEDLPIKLLLDGTTQRALAAPDKIADELQGITSGTALAAAIRPLGLVLVPEKGAGGVQLRMVDSRAARESWPVGWPAKKPPKDVLPALFKFLNVEVNDTPLAESLEAVRGRLEVPMLVDHNSLARQKVDLATTKVTLPKINTFYSRILDRLLVQAKLKYELRVDEAEHPFLWITTLRQ
jgi:hypothetical protein